MNKLILCRTATIVCGLLAIVVYTRPTTSHFTHWNGAALGLLSAIFGTQWIEYQKRRKATLAQSDRSGWFRRLLSSSVRVGQEAEKVNLFLHIEREADRQ